MTDKHTSWRPESLERSPIIRPYTGGDIGQRVVLCKIILSAGRVILSDSDDDARITMTHTVIRELRRRITGSSFDFDIEDIEVTVEEPSKE